ncbi:MAG: sigma-70 family RNA polymerase sigma factor, partial [Planctomycetota bacterium]
LRAWLSTVARRRASRRSRREYERHHVEARAASPEAVSGEATSERIQLHVDIAREVQALPEVDRRVLVGFFLEGRSQRELAAEEGVPVPTLRKRVARAKDRLRARLAASPRGSEGWSLGLALLAREGGAASISTNALRSLAVPALTMKLTSVLLMIAAVAIGAIWTLTRGEDASTSDVANLALPERDRPAVEDSSASADLTTVAELTDRRVGTPSKAEESDQSASDGGARSVRIVDDSGQGLGSARAAWIEPAGDLVELEVDDGGLVELPDSGSGRLFAAAPRFLAQAFPIADDEATESLALERTRALEGRITVDGVTPGERLPLREFIVPREIGLGDKEPDLEPRLRRILGLSDDRLIETDPTGTFRIEPQWKLTAYELSAPESFLVDAVNGVQSTRPTSSFELSLDGAAHTVELVALPAITGRLVWIDDRSPVEGYVNFHLAEANGDSSLADDFLSDDGRFSFSPVIDRYKIDPRNLETSDWTMGGEPIEFATKVRIILLRAGIDLGVVWSAESEALPVDLGVIEVPRWPQLEVRTIDARTGAPVDAVVRAAAGPIHTGSDGVALVDVVPDGRLDVLAMGYRYESVELTAAHVEQRLPVRVELEPAPTLVVRRPPDPSQSERAEVELRLEFDHTPFATAELDDELCGVPYDVSLHSALQGPWLGTAGWSHAKPGAPGYTEFTVPPNDVLRIGGLVEGGKLRVVLVDGSGEVKDTRDVELGSGETELLIDESGSRFERL